MRKGTSLHGEQKTILSTRAWESLKQSCINQPLKRTLTFHGLTALSQDISLPYSLLDLLPLAPNPSVLSFCQKYFVFVSKKRHLSFLSWSLLWSSFFCEDAHIYVKC